MTPAHDVFLAALGRVLFLLALAAPAAAAESGADLASGTASLRGERYSPTVLDLAATLPVQSEGRVKPLDTYASFLLLRLNGKRSVETPDGAELTAIEWLLDCLLFPEEASNTRCLLVANDEVLDVVGLEHPGRKKRDRYSLQELAPARIRISQAARNVHGVPEAARSLAQTQVLGLARNVAELETLLRAFDWARHDFATGDSAVLRHVLSAAASREGVRMSALLERWRPLAELRQLLILDPGQLPEDLHMTATELERELAQLDRLDREIWERAQVGRALALLPPPGGAPGDGRWLSSADLIELVHFQAQPAPQQIEMLAALEDLARAARDPPRFEAALADFHSRLTGLATERGQYGRIPLEVSYYRGRYFFWALLGYLVSFVVVAISWLPRSSRRLGRLIAVLQALATATLVTGITLRCIIRGRPPVTTLYETILFVTASAVLVAMIVEWMNRGRVGQAAASILGAGGLFLAGKFELSEAVDTMPQLIAVLDTNFWLATHVTTVTIGYAAGLLAAAIAHVWVIGKLLGLKRGDDQFYRGVARMVYGVICFGLFFSVVGTILGGIWANDSWGRFWGWDPKENGALMIVLWELAILHGRLGGYLKQPGLCLAAIAGGMVVAFSWWGVNFLGIGLHSYGFPELSQVRALYAFYGLEALVLVAGGLRVLGERVARRRLRT